MTEDSSRRAAVHAAALAMAKFETNAVAAPLIWRVVNDALDAYESDLLLRAQEIRSSAWAVVDSASGKIEIVLPTKRAARQQRRMIATVAHRYRFDYRIVPTVQVSDLSRT